VRTEKKFGGRETEEFGEQSDRGRDRGGSLASFGLTGSLFAG